MLTRTPIVLCLVFLSPALSLGQSLPSTYPSHYLAITPADSTNYGSLYSDQATRDSIRSNWSNAYRAAKAIERYALKQQPTPFLKTVENDSGRDRWQVALANGDTTGLGPKDVSKRSVGQTFEHYHPDHKLIVFQSHWREGGRYVLLSRVDGASARTFGPPVFSPSGKWFIAFNEDTVAGYSPNGIEIFKSKENPEEGDFGFEKVLSYRMEKIGPTRGKWTGKNTFRMETLVPFFLSDGSPNYEHYRVDIRKSRP